MKYNCVGWFEVPVANMDRAVKFYEDVFGYELERDKMGETDMAMFPMEEKAAGAAGALVYHPDFYKPSHDGTLVYFTSPSGDLNKDLEKVKKSGGKVLKEKTSIGEHGFIAYFEDTEGNRIALHFMK